MTTPNVRALMAWARAKSMAGGDHTEMGVLCEAGACQECLSNDDPHKLPMHINCRCVAEPRPVPAIPVGTSGFGTHHGVQVAGFQLGPLPGSPSDGYVLPVYPSSEVVFAPVQVTSDAVKAVLVRNSNLVLGGTDTFHAAWVTPNDVTVGVVRRISSEAAADHLSNDTGAPILNLASRSAPGTDPSRPVLILLPRDAGAKERAAFVAAIKGTPTGP